MGKMREWASYDQAHANLVTKAIEFAGRKFKPTNKLAYVRANFCHSLPQVNSLRRAFTAATLANSFASAQMQLFDFEHRLRFYGDEEDRICGAIAAAQVLQKEQAMELASEGKPVPMEIVFAIWRKARGVEAALEEMASDSNPWRVSMECEWPLLNSALWDGEKAISWADATADEKALVKPNTVESLNGKDYALLMGGADGQVEFTGGALTRWPADRKAKLLNVAANEDRKLIINCGWKSHDDWLQAAASEAEDAPASNARAGALVIGRTSAAEDGHSHEVTTNLEILTADGHSHYLRPVTFDPATGEFQAIASTYSRYLGDGKWAPEHSHTIVLGGGASSAVSNVKPPDHDGGFSMKNHVKWLREQAKAAEKSSPDLAKALASEADKLEQEIAGQDVEKLTEDKVAARIKSGDLVPKAQHQDAVAAADKAGYERKGKEVADAQAAEQKRAEVVANRLKAVKDAGLDASFVLGANRTIESTANAIPVDEAGEKAFAERLEEWKSLASKTGQAKASDNKGKGGGAVPPFGGGSTNDKDKGPIAYV